MFDDIVAQADEELLSLPDAARAEVWVSAIFGSWRQAGIADGLDPESIDREFLAHLIDQPSEAGLAIARAASAMDIDGVEGVLTHLGSLHIAEPVWAHTVGTAKPTGAWSVRDLGHGVDSLIIEFVHDDGLDHSMLVEVEQGVAVDILFGPAGLIETFRQNPDPELVAEEAAVSDVAARIGEALGRTAAEPDPTISEEFGMNIVLASSRLAALGSDTVEMRPVVAALDIPPRDVEADAYACLLYTSPSPRDLSTSRMPSSA